MSSGKPYLLPDEPGRCWLRSDRRLFDTTPRRHTELVAFLAIRGRMRYFIDGRVVTLTPGALLWAHTDQSHVLLSESMSFDMWVLVIAPQVLTPGGLFPPRFAAGAGVAPQARQLERHAAAELETVAAALRGCSDPQLLAAGLRWWTARAWAFWREARTVSVAPVHPAVSRAVEILSTNAEVPFTQVARRAGLSLSRLRRVFQVATGKKLTEFRTERRLACVDALLMRPSPPPLLRAALDAGFGSYSQFYRAFVAARGASPRDYGKLPEPRASSRPKALRG